ncbi:hypothetical protein NE237_003512 [Protea cynaroides]|uniref:Protein kinase domain-containing protein n=1 Tax=Protea cynaroides TaxID=273540 RepID=A0A9Q0KGV6_9MAGN|nr:hypothetical protein NE237_003512 [Protea cynaroides]
MEKKESEIISRRPQRQWVRLNCIGKCSFGTVNLASYVSDGGVFAVKSVNSNSSLTSQIESLENKIQILRSLSSPYVVQYLRFKGKNVLLGFGSTADVAKLVDFGSSKLFSSDVKMTLARWSPLWMAPEVVRGERQGPESDVWSLGCTVIEMVTGKPA